MNLKFDLTNYLIKELKLISPNKKSFNSWKHLIWKNPRLNKEGSLGLTALGFDLMCKANIHYYSVNFETYNLELDNKFILWLDRNFKFPYFLSSKRIYFFSKKPAVELALFSGDLKKYYQSHQRFQQKCESIDNKTD